MTTPSKEKAKQNIQTALDAIPRLKKLDPDSEQFWKWHRDTRIAISYTFLDGDRNIKDFDSIYFSLPISVAGTILPECEQVYIRGLKSATEVLQSMLDEIEQYWPEDIQESAFSSSDKISKGNTNEVFIIHGRDTGSRDMVARFLEQLKLKPVILSEQPNKGLTIIKKFEKHSEVGFAVALLTPDDTGSLEGGKKQPRARQNVIFELGFFIGRIGRERVCALTKGEVEIPSDYSGVVYIPLDDSGGWKSPLLKELKTAGFDIDANLMYS